MSPVFSRYATSARAVHTLWFLHEARTSGQGRQFLGDHRASGLSRDSQRSFLHREGLMFDGMGGLNPRKHKEIVRGAFYLGLLLLLVLVGLLTEG